MGFCFCFGHTYSIWKFLGQGSNLSHGNDNPKSLTARPPGNSLSGSFRLFCWFQMCYARPLYMYAHHWILQIYKSCTSYSTKRKLPNIKILAITMKLFREDFPYLKRKMLKRIHKMGFNSRTRLAAQILIKKKKKEGQEHLSARLFSKNTQMKGFRRYFHKINKSMCTLIHSSAALSLSGRPNHPTPQDENPGNEHCGIKSYSQVNESNSKSMPFILR